MKKVLFVSNEAGRTGAPAIMLGLVDWLKTHHEIDAISVLMRDGALREEFDQICRTYTWSPADMNKPERFYKRIIKAALSGRQSDPGDWLIAILEKEQPDIIYLSTLVLGKYLQHWSPRPNQKIITHVHELLPTLQQLSSENLVKIQLDLSDIVISCAPCVEETLTNHFGLPAHKCSIIPEYIILPDQTLAKPQSNHAGEGSERIFFDRLQTAIDEGRHIFGIGGTPIQRKGFDLFPLLAKEYKQQFDSPFLAVWIGCNPGSEPHTAMEWDLKKMDLQDEVMLIPSVSMPTFRRIVSHLDVLTLLSREDPFPLVVLEAGLLGIPTVCFKGSGAIPEFAAKGECVSVDYLNIPAFAAAIHRLCMNPSEAESIGERCRQKVKTDLTLQRVAPQVAKLLLSTESNVQESVKD